MLANLLKEKIDVKGNMVRVYELDVVFSGDSCKIQLAQLFTGEIYELDHYFYGIANNATGEYKDAYRVAAEFTRKINAKGIVNLKYWKKVL